MRRSVVILATLVGASACTDPSVTVSLTGVPAEAETLRVTVLELTDTTCADVSLGRVDADTFSAGVRAVATFPAGGGAPLADIPRLGPKLIVAGAYRNRTLVAAGCSADAADIDADLPVTIALAPTVRLRLAPGPLDPTAPPSLLLPAPATALTVQSSFRIEAPAATVAPQVFARSPAGEAFYAAAVAEAGDTHAVTLPAGLPQRPGPCAPPDTCPAVGPVELVIRAPWAEGPVRLSAYVPAATYWREGIATAGAPSWAFLETDVGTYAAAITGGGGAEALTVFTAMGAAAPTRIVVPAPTARAVTAFHTTTAQQALAGFVTQLADGWYFLDPAATPPALVPIPNAAPLPDLADTLIELPPCGPGPSLGVIAGRAAAPYVGVPNPRHPQAAAIMPALTAALADLASGASLEVHDAVCAAPGRPAVVVASSVDGVEHVTLLTATTTPARIPTPFVGTVASYGTDGGLAGAVITPTGLRLGTFKLTNLDTAPAFALTDLVDHPLAGRPTSIRIIDANGDAALDSLAVVDVNGERRVQLTLGSDAGPITALVAPELGARELVLTGVDLLGDDRRELVVASRAGIAAYNLTRPAAP
ncbi:MAG: hypothetical protein R3B06_26515 [Kofleriaceae bacterium]